jgi:transposase
MVQRVEVITGVERRRRHSDEEKMQMVAEAMESGSFAAVARKYDVSTSLLFAWRKRLCLASAEWAAPEPPPRASPLTSPQTALDELKVEVQAFEETREVSGRRLAYPQRIRDLAAFCLTSGMQVSHVAKVTGLGRTTVKNWRPEERKAALPAARPAPQDLAVVDAAGHVAADLAPTPGFVQVAAVRTEAETPTIRVRIGSDVFVEFPQDFEPRRLAAFVKAARDG